MGCFVLRQKVTNLKDREFSPNAFYLKLHRLYCEKLNEMKWGDVGDVSAAE